MDLRIATWNMNHWQRNAEQRVEAWRYLREEIRADVALLQEAVPPADLRSVYRPIGGVRPWGSAIMCLSPQ